MTRKKTKRGSGFGVLFWMAFILFVVALYLHNRSDIQQVLENTALVETLSQRFGSDDSDSTDSESSPELSPDTEDGGERDTPARPSETPQIELVPDEQLNQDISPERDSTESDSSTGESAERDSAEREEETPVEDPATTENGDATTEPDSAPDPPSQAAMRLRDFPLYFIRVTDEGTIYPDRVVREVAFVDAPLTAMLEVLIDGPNTQEIERGLHHLIPEDTRLLSASVRGGIAYLNFNEAFQFNPLGVEGYMAQLKQIVYSTTEFSTVDAVQILIEGREREFLGGDGVYIGKPLRRDSFG